MFNFWKKFSHILIFLTIVGIVGCESDVKEKDHEASSFLVGDITVQQSERYSNGVSGKWSEIIGSRHITLKTCLEDKAIEKYPVRSQEFRIKSPTYNDVRKTDHLGCLSWTEVINFNFLAPESIYHYPVTITGVGDYRGKKTRELGINPWKSGGETVKDLKEVDSVRLDGHFNSENLKKTFKISKNLPTSKRPMLIKNVNFSLKDMRYNKTAGAQELVFEHSLNPVLQRESLSGEMKSIEVSSGRIGLHLELYEQFSGSDTVRLISQKSIEKDFQAGQIEGEFFMKFPPQTQIRKSSSLVMLIQAKPLDVRNELPSDLGVIHFQDLKSNTNVGFTRLRSKEEFFRNNKLRQDKESLASLSKVSDYKGLEKKWFHALGVDHTKSGTLVVDDVFIQQSAPGAAKAYSSSKESMTAQTELCIRDLFYNRRIADTEFQVTVSKLNQKYQSKTVKTISRHPVEPNGCVKVDVPVAYNIYDMSYWRPYKIRLETLNGRHEGTTIDRLIAVNPLSEKSVAIDTRTEELPQNALDIADTREGEKNAQFKPHVFFGDVEYTNEGKVFDSIKLNRYLQLGFHKQLKLAIKPKLKRTYGHDGYEEETDNFPSINFGQFEMEVVIYSPKKNDVNFDNIDFTEWNVLSATKTKVENVDNGVIKKTIDFPLMVGDSLSLTFKNLIVVKLKPIGEEAKYLRSYTAAAPFFGVGGGSQVYAEKIDKDWEPRKEVADYIEKISDKKLDGMMISADSTKYSNLSSPSPLKLFRNHFEKSALSRNKEAKVYMGDLEGYNRLPKKSKDEKRSDKRLNQMKNIAMAKATGKRNETHDITKEELDLLTTKEEKPISHRTLAKFCNYYFDVPRIRYSPAYPKGKLISGEKYQACIRQPQKFIQTKPLYHIREIVPWSKVWNDEGELVKVIEGKFNGGDEGNINHGEAYMIADGEIERKTTGAREADYFFLEGTLGISPLSSISPGINAGMGHRYEVFENTEAGRTLWSFDRNFSRRDIKYEIEWKDIKFKAKIHKCVAITSKARKADRIHICRDEDDTPQVLNERWYFIGRHQPKDMGPLKDGSRVIDNQNQIIRGKSNYHALWGREKDKKAKAAIIQIKDSRLDRFSNSMREKQIDPYEYETFIDNAFPGVYIPREHDTVEKNYSLKGKSQNDDNQKKETGLLDGWW